MYLFGAYSPITGDHFEFEFPQCNGDNFQIFLDEFSKQDPDEFKIVILDNGAFHKVVKLVIPKNIKLVFIPPYSPELNPSEKIWWKMKRAFTGKLHEVLDSVSDFITEQVQALSKDIVKSICGFEYILSCPIWTKT
jgi:transposase